MRRKPFARLSAISAPVLLSRFHTADLLRDQAGAAVPRRRTQKRAFAPLPKIRYGCGLVLGEVSMGRIVLAGVLGGVAMFVVMSIFHMSPVAQIGFSMMKDDAAALSALQTATDNKPGLYIYPTVDMKAKDAMAKAEAARKTNPSGILIY